MSAISLYRNNSRIILALLILICLIPSAKAQTTISTTNLSDNYFRAGEGLSMGGAYRAIANSPAAILYNPAGIAQLKGEMQVSGDYAYQEDIQSHLFGVGVVDYQSSPTIAYGLSYHRFSPTIGGVTGNVNQTIISAGYALGSFMQLGLSGKGYWVNLDSSTQQGPRGLDMDVGALIHPFPILALGVTGYNLFRGGRIEEFPRSLGMGAALIFDPHAKLSFDIVKNLNTPAASSVNYYTGAELRVAESAYLRGGFAFDQIANNNYYSVGGGLIGPKAGLIFTFSQRLSPTSETYAVTVNFTI